MDPEPIGQAVMELRRHLAWRGYNTECSLHCTSDKQLVRDEMFALIQKHQFRVDATIVEKRKTLPRLRPTEVRFYQHAWYFHFKHVGPKIFSPKDEAHICAASTGTHKKKAAFKAAVHDVCGQAIAHLDWQLAFWEAATDPCLLVADYCCWAIQRKWEAKDERSYALIAKNIATEFDLWRWGTTYHY
jgi:hypothetical protein